MNPDGECTANYTKIYIYFFRETFHTAVVAFRNYISVILKYFIDFSREESERVSIEFSRFIYKNSALFLVAASSN